MAEQTKMIHMNIPIQGISIVISYFSLLSVNKLEEIFFCHVDKLVFLLDTKQTKRSVKDTITIISILTCGEASLLATLVWIKDDGMIEYVYMQQEICVYLNLEYER